MPGGEISQAEPIDMTPVITVGYLPTDRIDLMEAIDRAAQRGELHGEQAAIADTFIQGLFVHEDPREVLAQLPQGRSDDGRINVRLQFPSVAGQLND